MSNNIIQNVINDAVSFAVGIANDNSHGYSQAVRSLYNITNPKSYDCSSLCCTAYYYAFLKNGLTAQAKELRENAVNERLDTLESELKKVKTTFLDNQETYHGQSIEIRNNLQANQESLSNQMTELKQLFINKEIDDMRWEMLDFASAIMNKRRCSKEQYDHVIDTYVKYEKILEENGMENGRVTSSMEFVNDKYKKLMSVGFDHDKLNE